MEKKDAIDALGALAQDHRLDAYRLLVQAGPAGRPAGQIAAALGLPPNTLSFHFDRLRQADLVTVRREGRSLIYAARFDTMNALVGYLTENCCGGQPELCTSETTDIEMDRAMSEPRYNVLFLCTGNSARSIIAEAILNHKGWPRFRAYSAGSQPKGEVNPHTIQLLDRLGYEADNVRSKSWSEFATPDAPKFDFIVTVCDNAAGEACPVWPGQPMTAHWGVPDPAEATGSPAEIAATFNDVHRMLAQRIDLLLALPIASLDTMSLQAKLRAIGAGEGATAMAREQR